MKATIDAKIAELALPALRLARQNIASPEDWAQGIAYRDCGGHMQSCLVHALDRAEAGEGVAAGRDGAARVVLYRVLPAPWQDLIEYNDAPGRTHAEVLCLLDDAIDCCEGVLFGRAYLRQPPAIRWRDRACVGEALAMAHANDDWDMWHGDEFVDVQIIQDGGPAYLYFHPVVTLRNSEYLMTTDLTRLLGWGIALHPAPEPARRELR